MSGQLTLPNIPGFCPHEIQCVDMGTGNLKSECDLTMGELGHSMWTNCRAWGSCTLCAGLGSEQAEHGL